MNYNDQIKIKNQLTLRLLRLFTGIILFCCADFSILAAQESNTTTFPSKTISIYYRVDCSEIDRNYMDNAETLNTIDRIFAGNKLEEGDFIAITGTASPEGGFDNNQRLARERALSLKKYIKQRYPQIADSQIIILPNGEDWEGLVGMIEKDGNIPQRSQLLKILNSNLSREKQKNAIKKINGGETYEYLRTHILPYLRGSATGTIYTAKKESLVRADTLEIPCPDTVFVTKEIIRIDTVRSVLTPQKTKKPVMVAIKTNLLYDALLLPNLAIEIPFGKNNRNWSVELKGNWSWWNTNANNYNYHRIQMAGVELRHWVGSRAHYRPLTGWYGGVYAYGGTYDIRLFARKDTDKGELSDLSYSAGVSAGYVMPIADRWNLEFGLAAGYLGGEYKKYKHSTCTQGTFPWLSTHRRNYFGLTKANVSIVWIIGR